MSVLGDLRQEIILRLNRETSLILRMCDMDSDKAFIKEMLRQNDESLKLINEFLCSHSDTATVMDWEKFVKKNYWEKQNSIPK